MDYVKFGKTGLGVSRLCLGCMTYGIPDRGPHPWTLDEEKSRPLIRQAVELGINFFDTANVYSDRTSEEIVGRTLKEFTRRRTS
jgi:1-deoxyxylulose-5-phosphate synthase